MFRIRRVAPLYFVAFVVIAAATRFGPIFRAPMLEQGDLAVNAIQIRHAKRLAELYGNYSRYEFNHPGPAFFYCYAAGEALFYDALHIVPSPGNAHVLALVCLQAFFLTATLCLIQARLPWRGLPALCLVGVCWWIRSHPELMVSVWPPHVLAVPFLCYLVAATSLAEGNLVVLPIAVLAGGFLVHGHVAQPLFVGAVGVTAWVLGRRVWRTAGGWAHLRVAHRTALVVSAVFAGLFLAPLVIDVITRGDRSNIRAILGRLALERGTHVTLLQSLAYFVTYPVASRAQDLLLTVFRGAAVWRFMLQHALAIAAWMAALLSSGGLLLAGRSFAPAERRLLRCAVAILGVTCASCLIWGAAQSGAVRHYNGTFFYAVYFFACVPAIAAGARLLDRAWRPQFDLAAAAAAAAILAVGLHARSGSPAERGLPIKAGVDLALGRRAERRPKYLVVSHSNWYVAAAVALELRRRNVEFCVPDGWDFMFQARHVVSRFDATIAGVDTWWLAPPGPGGIRVAPGLALFTQPARLDPNGGDISFARAPDAFRYAVFGLQDGDFISPPLPGMSTDERRLILRFAPLPASGRVTLFFDVASAAPSCRSMPGEVVFNHRPVARVNAGVRNIVPVTISAADWNRAPVASLTVLFPEAVRVHSAARPDYTGWRAWRVWDIRFASARAPDAGHPRTLGNEASSHRVPGGKPDGPRRGSAPY